MKENNWLGSKSGQGFYKKTIDENGQKNILELDLGHWITDHPKNKI